MLLVFQQLQQLHWLTMYAGNLMAASILQGGTAPCFLKKWVYDYMIMGLSEQLELSIDDITASEMKNFVEKVHLPENQVFEYVVKRLKG